MKDRPDDPWHHEPTCFLGGHGPRLPVADVPAVDLRLQCDVVHAPGIGAVHLESHGTPGHAGVPKLSRLQALAVTNGNDLVEDGESNVEGGGIRGQGPLKPYVAII